MTNHQSPMTSFFRPQNRVNHRHHLQHPLRLPHRHLGEAVGHERFAAVLLPPAADGAVLAYLADHELAGGGAASLAELDDEEVAVFDALIAQILAAGAEDDL